MAKIPASARAPKAAARSRKPTQPPARVAARILNCLPSPKAESDWSFGDGLGAGVAERGFPARKDLREPWWGVGNQGNTGSCVGWATADSLLRWHLVKARRIPTDAALSVRFIWMAAKEADEFVNAPTTFIEPEGTSLKAALDVARKYGVVLEGDLPFAGGQLFAGRAQVFYARAAQCKIASYLNLGRTPTSWRRWIANNGPVLTRLDVDLSWQDVGPNGRLDTYRPETAQGGHAVSLVGYDENGFIVRNSWGTTWGDGGFAYASNAYAIAAFTEAYGVTLGEGKIALETAAATAAVAAPSRGAKNRIEEIEAIVKRMADRLTNRDIPLGERVGIRFPDIPAIDRLLGKIQDGIAGAGGVLVARPSAEKLTLTQGSYLDLADWVEGVLEGLR